MPPFPKRFDLLMADLRTHGWRRVFILRATYLHAPGMLGPSVVARVRAGMPPGYHPVNDNRRAELAPYAP